MTPDRSFAHNEIAQTLRLCNFFTSVLGLPLLYTPRTAKQKLTVFSAFIVTMTFLFCLVFAEIAYIVNLFIHSVSVEAFVVRTHITGYGAMSVGKGLTLWYKIDKFRQLVRELAEIWPVDARDNTAGEIKRGSINGLRIGQSWYAFWNVLGIVLYSVTPIVVLVYYKIQGVPRELGFIWSADYPFDKTKPIIREAVFVFEALGGTVSVCCMLGCDLFFTAMSSHLSMMLKILQNKIRDLYENGDEENSMDDVDRYPDIVASIEIHQRIITYTYDVEEAFSASNFLNILLSSVNICCVMFNVVLLDSWMEMGNKFYMGAALTQVGILCWYADEICRASLGVADAAYESGWYKGNAACRRALLFLIQRSQKPLCFTALKFSSITMSTYSSILTSSYSYFTLLYTVYRNN